MLRIACFAFTAILLTAPAARAQVYTDHLLGKYSTTEDGCAADAVEFEIRRGIVEGPGVFCILGATKPTDIGTEAYEANCRQPGVIGTLTFDLSKKSDHIRIMLPESKDWLTLFACK